MAVTKSLIRVRKQGNSWVVYFYSSLGNELVQGAFASQPEAMEFALHQLAKWRAIRDSYTAGLRRAVAPELLSGYISTNVVDNEGMRKHLREWDKRHLPSGKLRFWYSVRKKVQWRWFPAVAAVAGGVGLVFGLNAALPDRSATLPSDIYTPFTKVPQPTRPPHPISIYVPPGYEGK